MKKAFVVILFFAILSLLSTLFPFNGTKDTKKLQDSLHPNNNVVTSTWPWIPMMQFDKYSPLFQFQTENNK